MPFLRYIHLRSQLHSLMNMTMTLSKVKVSIAIFLFAMPMLVSAQVRIGLGGGGYFGLKDQGINASIQVQKDLSDLSSLTVQLGFIGKPSNLPQDNLNPDFDYFAGRISYVVVPLEFQYYLPFKKFRIGAFGGPYVGYGLKASILKRLDDFNFEKIEDPNNLIEGTGQKMRHIKIKNQAAMDKKVLAKMVKQAAKKIT